MKKYPRIVQCDKRGQIVIPKDIRNELKIDEGSGFWMYTVTDEGILLKKIEDPNLTESDSTVSELSEKAEKIDLNKANLHDTIEKYKKTKDGNLDVI
ncbi:MAG: AbrB/MazE/SpoVT family DNA-binding domain-containing protein [Candidatus Woesearchaeota archaeon]